IDGQSLGEYAGATSEDIQDMMAKARSAVRKWSALSVKQRSQILSRFPALVLADLDGLCTAISHTTGKVMTEALLGEIYPVMDLAAYYCRHADQILSPQNVVTSPLSFPGAEAQIIRKPYGVVALITPWNYPFQITVCQLLGALIAGNAVIIKLSEFSLPVGKAIVDLFAQLDLPDNTVQWLIGDGNIGAQLITSAPDMVVFTGSLTTGRAVMQCAAQHPIPVLLELGGKDAMVVCADADLERTCHAAVYGAFCNSGQACVSVERLYVEQSCFETFKQKLCAATANLKVGHGMEGDLGVMTVNSQVDKVKAHYEDAINKGAKASAPLNIQGNSISPVILWDVTADMLIMKEETFGPLLPVIPFINEEEAICLANQSEFGLNASVWSQDINKAERIARQLQVGNWAINDVIKNIGHPRLPFGGCKHSGFGRYRGTEGLLQMTYPVSGLTSSSHFKQEPNWFPFSQSRYQTFKGYLDVLHGDGNFISRARRNLPALQDFREYSSFNLKQGWQNLKLSMPWRRQH
ncbi:partial succinate-semialdehyde dehydrogenase / glutarate-semialdehyde dehydrogenase, partial [biofilm metagenome]